MDNKEKNSKELFAENFQNLMNNAPEGVQYFAILSIADDEIENKRRCVSCCDTNGGELAEMFGHTISQQPEIRQGIEMGLMLSKIKTNPLKAFSYFLGRL